MKSQSHTLDELIPGTHAIVVSIDESRMEPGLLRDCWDQGFLPGTEIVLLEKFLSQNKILVQIGSEIRVALPIPIAQYIRVEYVQSKKYA